MLNKCGEIKKKKIIKSKEYNVCSFNERVGIIYNKKYSVYKILENLNDAHNLITRIDTKNENGIKSAYILYCVYLPPTRDHEILIGDFLNKLNMIKNRYKNAKIIVFGDFNLKRDEFKNKIENVLGKEFTYHYNKEEQNFTRYRITKNNIIEKSYLDYFITTGFKNTQFEINLPIGKSDHLSLELYISKKDIGEIIVQREIVYPYNKLINNIEDITKSLIKSLENKDKVKSVVELIRQLNNNYKPRVKKINKGCVFLNKIDNYNKKFKKGQSFDNFAKYITHMSNIEYSSFIKILVDLLIDNRKKEFFQRIRFYSNLNKNVDILKDLELITEDNEIKVEVNQDIIENKVREKYIKMLRDNGYKEKYNYKNEFIKFYTDDILRAINLINPDKAISFDYLPGKFLNIINKILNKEEYMRFIYKLTDFYNELINNDEIPEEIITSRLFCLNKVASEPGKLDNIRPIAIFGPLFKIMEKCILEHLMNFINRNKILSKKQTGFIPKLGCEVNLARLRQRVHDVLEEDDQSYLLFIDLKNAYDSVNHKKLFEKMRKLNAPEKLINTISKIYSFAKMKINIFQKPMNVNRGVLQGSILSPMLFNIYINDLIKEIDENAFEVLAYADDIAVICKNKNELLNVMNIIDKWAINNDVLINKKKSGILVLKRQKNNIDNINDYPIKANYKYLGIEINNEISPMTHLYNVNRKLSDYLKRNNWLLKTYFSPKSLLLLANYYQISRLTYGMCIFLDDKRIMESVETARLKYFRSILGTKNNINNNLIRLVLCLPKMEYLLFNRLLNVIDKYKLHFEENITIYDEIVNAFNERTNANLLPSERLRYMNIKYSIINATAKQENIIINKNYINYHNKYYYKYADRRDGLLIRFFCKYGFFNSRLFPDCEYCGENNSRTHIVNECKEEFFVNIRNEYINKIKKLKGNDFTTRDNLEEMLMNLYFQPGKDVKESLKLLKEFVAKFYIERPKRDEDYLLD